MKTTFLSIVSLLIIGTMTVFAENKTEKFKVYGNCSMCETRIEKAAKAVEGVTFADWDKKTKKLVVTFDDSKTNVLKVHMAVAAVGHDTETHQAKEEAYNKLHACCKYERAPKKANSHVEHKH